MTDTPVPAAAVQIAAETLGLIDRVLTYAEDAEYARAVVAALARAGWLHDPAELAALRTENYQLRYRAEREGKMPK